MHDALFNKAWRFSLINDVSVGHRKSIVAPPSSAVPRTACLTAALQPVIAVMIKHNSLDPGEQKFFLSQ